MKTPQGAKRFMMAFLVASAIALVLVIRPIASSLFMAAILAGVLWPMHRWLLNRLRNRRGLSAGILTTALAILVLTPLVALSAYGVGQGIEGYKFVAQTVRSDGVKGLLEKVPRPLHSVRDAIAKRLPGPEELEAAIQENFSEQSGRAAAAMGAAMSATGSVLFRVAMMLIALFFLLTHGAELVDWVDEISPLRKGQTQELLGEFKKVSYSVLVSTVVTALVQAVAALVGFLISSLPYPIFFAGVTFFVAFIPALGAASVVLFASAILYVTGHPYLALFLALWGVIVVGLVDNIVKPWLIKGGIEMNGAVVFFALIGGLAAFGAVGLILGPLVVSLFLTLLRMYRRDFAGQT